MKPVFVELHVGDVPRLVNVNAITMVASRGHGPGSYVTVTANQQDHCVLSVREDYDQIRNVLTVVDVSAVGAVRDVQCPHCLDGAVAPRGER